MRTLYIVKTGSTLPSIAHQHGDFEHWIDAAWAPVAATGSTPALSVTVLHACDDTQPALDYPAPTDCAGVVITGSHAMVTDDAPWMQSLAQWLHTVCMADVPVLGICFGHQLLARLLGGHVDTHPGGLELGTVPIAIQADVSTDPLWRHMPALFEAHVVHYQSVRRLPAHACVLAGNAHEPHQAFRWRNHVWGVQFHPEFTAASMQGYIDHLAQSLEAHGVGPAHLRQTRCTDTPEAAQLLQHFMRHAQRYAHQQAAAAGTAAPCAA